MPAKKKSVVTPSTITIGNRDFIMPTSAENRRIIAAAKRDPDAQPLTDAQLKAMVPFKSIRGRPKLDRPKVLVSIRYSTEVLDYFRDTGDGWQSRIDGVLKEYVRRQVTKSGRHSG